LISKMFGILVLLMQSSRGIEWCSNSKTKSYQPED